MALRTLSPEKRRRLSDLLANVDDVVRRPVLIDIPFRTAVRERLRQLDVSQHELAAWIGVTQAHVGYVLSDQAIRSDIVERVAGALRLPLPAPARIEIAVAKLLKEGREDQLAQLVDNVERFVRQ